MTDKDKIRAEIKRRMALNFKRKQGSRSLEDNDILSFIDSMQEEPAPKIFEDMLNAKTPAESLGISAEEHDKIINLCLYGKEPEMVDIDDLPKEEPVSEELEQAAVEAFKQIVDSDKNNFLEIFKAGAEFGKNQTMAEIQAQSMAFAHGCPEENTSNNLKEAADNALESITDQYDIISVGSCLEMFRLGSQWQKEKDQKK